MNKHFSRVFLGLSLCLILAACDGGSNGGGMDEPPPSDESVTISGTVVDGPVDGATVVAYSVESGGGDGAELGTASTSADGTFSLELDAVPTGAVRLKSTGGTYTSEAEITKTYSSQLLSVMLDEVPEAGLSDIVITPLTTLVDSRASALLSEASSAKAFSEASGQAEDEIKSLYGFSGDAPAFSGLRPDFLSGAGNGARVGLVIGSFQELGRRLARNPGEVLRAIAQDLRDGEPDGRDHEAPVLFGEDDPAPITLATSDFLGALSSYIDPANLMTILAANDVELDPAVVEDVRGAIVEAAPESAALQIGSSGAVTVITSAGTQIVYIAARENGIKAIDMTDPENPVLLPLTELNESLAALDTPLTNIGGVIAVPGAATPQLVLYDYSQARVVLADVAGETVLADVDLADSLETVTGFSGGSAYISSGIPDPTRGVVWLATGDGYYPFDYSTFELGTPIDLVGGQLIAENIGGNAGADLLFSPNYGAGSGGGLQLVNLVEKRAYAMDDDQFQEQFAVPNGGEGYPFGIVDAGAVDSTFNVGILTGEDTPYVAFLDMNDSASFVFDDDTETFSISGAAQTVVLNTQDESVYPVLSGAAVDSQTHLALFMAGYSTTIMVGELDDPMNPAGDTWVGMTDWAVYSPTGSEYSYSRDPHAVGVVQAIADSQSYGFLLSSAPAILMIDMAAFLEQSRVEVGHALAATPFDGAVVKTIAIGGSSALKQQPAPETQRGFGFTYQQ